MSKDTESKAEESTERKANLKLWKLVDKTPPAMTKPVKYGARKFTAVDPQYQLLEATSLWGPYGERWGLRNIKYEIVTLKGNDIVTLEKKDAKGNVVESVQQVADLIKHSIILEAEFFYPGTDGQTVSFPMINDDRYQAGDDALKKIVTNTRSKALSYLGFSADVFLGMFDDTAYVKKATEAFDKQDRFVNDASNAINSTKSLTELIDKEIRLKQVEAESRVDQVSAEYLRELIEKRKAYFLSKELGQS